MTIPTTERNRMLFPFHGIRRQLSVVVLFQADQSLYGLKSFGQRLDYYLCANHRKILRPFGHEIYFHGDRSMLNKGLNGWWCDSMWNIGQLRAFSTYHYPYDGSALLYYHQVWCRGICCLRGLLHEDLFRNSPICQNKFIYVEKQNINSLIEKKNCRLWP